MLEVLIALVIFAIGMLGIAALQAQSLLMNRYAGNYAAALQMAQDLKGQILANPAAQAAGAFMLMEADAASHCAVRMRCDPGAIARGGYRNWLVRLNRLLPGAKGIVCHDSSPADGNTRSYRCDGGGAPVIKIWWTERDGREMVVYSGLEA